MTSDWVDDSNSDCEIIFETVPAVASRRVKPDATGKKGAIKTPASRSKTTDKCLTLKPKGKGKGKGKSKGKSKSKAQFDDDETESEPDAGALQGDDDSDFTCESVDDDDSLDDDDSPFKSGPSPVRGTRRVTRRLATQLKQNATPKLELEDSEDDARPAAGSSRRPGTVVVKPPLPGLRKSKPRPEDFEWQRTDSETSDDDDMGLGCNAMQLCESSETAGVQKQLRALIHMLRDTQQPLDAFFFEEVKEQWHALVQDALAAPSLEPELRVEILDCLLDHIRALLAQSHDDSIDASRCAVNDLSSLLAELLWGVPGFMDLVREPKRAITFFTPEALQAVATSPAQLPTLLFCMGAVASQSSGLRDQLARKTSIITAMEQLCATGMKAKPDLLTFICYLIGQLSKNARMASDLAVGKGWSFALSCLGHDEPVVLHCALQAMQAMLKRSSESTAERLVDPATLEDMCDALDRMLTTTAGHGDGEELKATTLALKLLQAVASSSPTNAQRLQCKLDDLDEPFSRHEASEPLCNAIKIALQSCARHHKSRSGKAVVKVEADSSEEEEASGHMTGKRGGSKSGYYGSGEIEEEEEFELDFA